MFTTKNPKPCSSIENQWLHLEDRKCFSRLLYTNPVCLLCTTNTSENSTKPIRNVMVVSWLTATNNNGRFVMSVNKRRHTASILVPTSTSTSNTVETETSTVEFVLSVPVAGMEDLVKNIGKTSGRWGTSKFFSNKLPSQKEGKLSPSPSHDSDSKRSTSPKKKNKFELGIEGLHAVKIGESEEEPASKNDLFGIRGTIAHLKCKINCIIDNNGGKNECMDTGMVDDDHYLISADVTDAYVKEDYWNEKKKVFQPCRREGGGHQHSPPPYLTFFGSQSFGYVLPSKVEEYTSNAYS